MCGVGGYYRIGPRTPKDTRAAVRALWLALQDRGTHAAGLAVLGADGGVPAIIKAGAPASHIAKLATGAAFAGHLPPRWIMLHTRHATSGSTGNNLNNHPLGADVDGPAAVCLIHNGVISNKAAVLKALAVEASRGVDSEAALACVRAGGVAKVAELCAGSLALVWNVGADIHLWTNGDNPLVLGCLASGGGGWLWASTRAHLDATGLTFGQVFDAEPEREYILTPAGLRRGKIYRQQRQAVAAVRWQDYGTGSLRTPGRLDFSRPKKGGPITAAEAAILDRPKATKPKPKRKRGKLRRQRWDYHLGGWVYD